MKATPQNKTQRPNCTAVPRGAFLLLGILASLALAGRSVAQVVSGNISPNTLEIDLPSANLQASGAAGFVDWIKDSLANTDTPSLVNSVATGIAPGVTGATGGKGHWNGVRIVDGIAGNDADIFLNGGKENDTTTWNIGPGTVGSSKYDITQAYLANNQTTLYFGMERRGNNGTTAFDFEFNQAGPIAGSSYVPTRTIGDVLFTFEMSGSGSSGSATPHYFIWNGSTYAEQIPAPASLVSSINNADTAAGPWGFVDSKGNWALGSIPKFEFAEASVRLADAFPNFSPCGNSEAYVEVRTRSSASGTSDLKDTTRIFRFRFGGPSATVSLGTDCAGNLKFDGSASKDSSGGTNLTYAWKFTPPSGVTLSGSGLTGPDATGAYQSTSLAGTIQVSLAQGMTSAAITANLTVSENATCSANSGDVSLTVHAPLSVAITDKMMTGSTLTVTLTASASDSAATLQWQRMNASGNWVDIAGATGSTLDYSSFTTDATPTVVDLNISGDPYQGKLYQVQLRVTAQLAENGVTCSATSQPITVKEVIAVDP